MTTIPTIHLNGTGAKTLQREIREAHDALQTARKVMADMTVHSRDHYVNPDKTSYTKARQEHIDRLAKIDEIQKELAELYQGIAEQV